VEAGDPKKTLEFLRRPGDSARAAGDDIGRAATVFGCSDVGAVRESNQDQFVIATLERTIAIEQCGLESNDGAKYTDVPAGRLLMVADGMGGQTHGEVASAVVVDAMLSYAFSMMPWLRLQDGAGERKLAEGLTRAVLRSRERMREVAERKGYVGDMGSTLTLAYVHWPTLYLVHVGDSRAYLFRGTKMHRLTRDHNLAEEMVRQNVLTEEEARESRFASVLTNSVSTSADEIRVELHQAELQIGDRLMLCTDGLYGEIGDSQISGRLMHVVQPDLVAPCVQSLVKLAKDAGGRDNITAVLALF